MPSKFVDMIVNNYLKTYDMYLIGAPDLSFNEILTNLNRDLQVNTQVNMEGELAKSNDKINYFFNFLCYPIFSIMILSIASVFNTIKQKDINRRNLCAPINNTSFSLQIFLGNIVFTIV